MSNLSDLTLVIAGNPTVEEGATGGIDLNAQVIPNVADPLAAQDAATKNYVDTTVASWTQALAAESMVDQGPVALDTIHQVEFGAAQGGGGDPVQISALGAVTFNQTGYYHIVVGVTIGRSAATGVATMIFRLLVNAVQAQLATAAQLSDDQNIRTTSSSALTGNFTAGDILTLEMQRSDQGGTGENDGGLFAIEDTGALAWGTSPSARLLIDKFNPL